MMNIVLKLKY